MSRPYPGSLCHSCAAPPRYVESDRGAVFIRCPIFESYPPQPVRACPEFRPSADLDAREPQSRAHE
jgi:hypothetical protein